MYYRDSAGKLHACQEAVFTDSAGQKIDSAEKLVPENIYEIRLEVEDSGETDCDAKAGSVETVIILASSSS